MMFLREAFSIVLIVALANAETCHSPGSEMQMNSSSGDHPHWTGAGAGPGLHSGESVNGGSYTLTFFIPTECTRRSPRPDTWGRSVTPDLSQASAATQHNGLGPLVKDALRAITSYLGVEARASSESQRPAMIIGIRG